MTSPAFEALLARHQTATHVTLVGDWHGDLPWAKKVSERQAELGLSKLLLHLGDFSIWPGNSGKKFLLRLDRQLQAHEQDILVTLGNHEDWGRLETLWANPKRQDGEGRPLPLQFGERIWVLPRPHRFELAGVSFLSLGGAGSVDVGRLQPGVDWWPGESIPQAAVEAAVASGPVDVLLTHETPSPPHCVAAVARILASNPFGFSEKGLELSKKSRGAVTQVLEAVKPKLLAHGHMHVSGEAQTLLPGAEHLTTVLSLDESMRSGNVRLLELEALRSWPKL